MPRPSFQVLSGGAQGSIGPEATDSRRLSPQTLQLVPHLAAAPVEQLLLAGMHRRKETLLSLGIFDLDYPQFRKLLSIHGVRHIVDIRLTRSFGSNGFPWQFESHMAQLGILYEGIDALANREERRHPREPSAALMARYAASLRSKTSLLTALRLRIEQGPLLLLGWSCPPGEMTDQDVVVSVLREEYPAFDFDLSIYSRNDQKYPWMEGEA